MHDQTSSEVKSPLEAQDHLKKIRRKLASPSQVDSAHISDDSYNSSLLAQMISEECTHNFNSSEFCEVLAFASRFVRQLEVLGPKLGHLISKSPQFSTTIQLLRKDIIKAACVKYQSMQELKISCTSKQRSGVESPHAEVVKHQAPVLIEPMSEELAPAMDENYSLGKNIMQRHEGQDPGNTDTIASLKEQLYHLQRMNEEIKLSSNYEHDLASYKAQIKIVLEDRDKLKSKLQRYMLARNTFENEKNSLIAATELLHQKLALRESELQSRVDENEKMRHQLELSSQKLVEYEKRQKQHLQALREAVQGNKENMCFEESISSLIKSLGGGVLDTKMENSASITSLLGKETVNELRGEVQRLQEENSNLKTRLASFQKSEKLITEALAELEKRYQEMEKQQQSSEHLFQDIQLRSAKLELSLQEYESRNITANMHFQEMAAEISFLYEKLESSNEMNFGLSENNESLCRKNKALQEERQEMVDKIALMDSEKRALQAKFEEQLQEAKQSSNDSQLCEAKLLLESLRLEHTQKEKQLEAEKAALDEKLQDALRAQADDKASFGRLKIELEQCQEKLAVALEKLSLQDRESKALCNHFKSKESEFVKNQQQLEMLQSEVMEHQNKIKKMETNQVSFQAQMQEKEEKIILLEKELQERTKTEDEKLDEHCQATILKEQNEMLQKTVDAVKHELMTLTCLKSQVDNYLASLKAELLLSEEEKRAAQEKLVSLAKEISSQTTMHNNLEQELKNFATENLKLKDLLTEAKSKVAGALKDNGSLQASLLSAQEELKQLSGLVSPVIAERDSSIMQLLERDARTQTLATRLDETNAELTALKKHMVGVIQGKPATTNTHFMDDTSSALFWKNPQNALLSRALVKNLSRQLQLFNLLKGFHIWAAALLKCTKKNNCLHQKDNTLLLAQQRTSTADAETQVNARTEEKDCGKQTLLNQIKTISRQSAVILEASRSLREENAISKAELKKASLLLLNSILQRQHQFCLFRAIICLLRGKRTHLSTEAVLLASTASFSPMNKSAIPIFSSTSDSPLTPKTRLTFESKSNEGSHSTPRFTSQTTSESCFGNADVNRKLSFEVNENTHKDSFLVEGKHHIGPFFLAGDRDSIPEQVKFVLNPSFQQEQNLTVQKEMFPSCNQDSFGNHKLVNLNDTLLTSSESQLYDEEKQKYYVSSCTKSSIIESSLDSSSFWNISALTTDETDEVIYK